MPVTIEDFKNQYEDGSHKWEQLSDDSSLVKISYSKGIFMKLVPRSDPYILRMITLPKVTRRHYEAFCKERYFPTSPAVNSNLIDADVAWSLGGFTPGPRYTAIVMDRDEDKPMILDFGRSVFDSFVNYMRGTSIDPAGREAPDFKIFVKNTGSGPLGRDYALVPMGIPTPLTDMEMAQAVNIIPHASLATKAAKPSEIRDAWMALPPDRKYSTRAKQKALERPGAGTSSPESVMSYIEKYSDSIYVPVLDKGKVIHASISQMSEEWIKAYSSFYIDFGLKPNRYKEGDELKRQEALLEEMAEAIDMKWMNPNEED